ncbi:MAG TPA: chemotaxis response regulator protein-glutamate methylesterase [Polyangia bacterium]|jgi:two-component system chemotaxis response regulator CheB
MPRTRILIVDDSVVARQMVADALAEEPQFEVVGTARNGRVAVEKVAQLAPDLVLLDVEMPEMDGLTALTEIRRVAPHLPVIMLSAYTTHGAEVTVDALARGASDYVTKPDTDDLAAAVVALRAELTPRIWQLCVLGERRRPRRAAAATGPAAARGQRPELIAIGASTGGPNALRELLVGLGRDFPVPLVIAQHMPPMFTRLLAQRLAIESGLQVREAVGSDALVPGVVLLAPGDHHMVVVRANAGLAVLLHQGPTENSCRPSVDVLFRSVAETCGEGALALVLTGMGQDGVAGCGRIREARGRVLVQDESTSVVWGMPGLVAQAGLAHAVVPLDEMAREVRRLVGRGPA